MRQSAFECTRFGREPPSNVRKQITWLAGRTTCSSRNHRSTDPSGRTQEPFLGHRFDQLVPHLVAKRLFCCDGTERTSSPDRDWLACRCHNWSQVAGLHPRGCHSNSDGTAGDRRVCRESARHLAHSLTAQPAFIAMESLDQSHQQRNELKQSRSRLRFDPASGLC